METDAVPNCSLPHSAARRGQPGAVAALGNCAGGAPQTAGAGDSALWPGGNGVDAPVLEGGRGGLALLQRGAGAGATRTAGLPHAGDRLPAAIPLGLGAAVPGPTGAGPVARLDRVRTRQAL